MKIGDSVWYCKRINNDEFSEPIEIKTQLRYFTVMGKQRGSSDIIDLGDTTSSELRAIAQPYELWEDTFSVGDRFYCNGVKPSVDEDYYSQNSNYVIDDIVKGNRAIELKLKKVAE